MALGLQGIGPATPMGATLLLTGTIAGAAARISLPPDEQVSPGETVWLLPDPARLSWLSPETGIALKRA